MQMDDSGDEVKVWLSYPNEVDQLARKAREVDWKRRIAILLMGKIGLRASSVPTGKPQGLTYNDDGEYWQLAVKGKNTKGGEKATRDAYVPDEVKRELMNYAKERDISPSESFVDVSTDSVRRWVREAARELTEDTGNDRWEFVSSHDLRRSWATHHLVEKDVGVRVMMEIGGWSSYAAIEPYLAKPTPSKIGAEMNNLSN